jgi:N-carbamoylputrescine amidase
MTDAESASGDAESASGDAFEVGLVQMAPTPDSWQNLSRAVELVGEAAAAGAKVVCLPELFRTLYFCQSEDAEMFNLAESIPGPSTKPAAGR